MMENQEMDVFSDLDVPVDLDVEALTELAQSRKTLQTFWETNPEICLEMLSEEKKISEIPVDVKKTNISQHIRTQQHTPKQSWLGIAGSLCVFIAIASLFWNFIPSSRNVEAISQVAGKSLPIVETKYATKNIEDIQEGDEVLAYDVRTGKTVKNKVSATFHLKSDHLRYLTVLDANGSEQTFQTTDTHPFWVNSDRPDLFRKARDSVSEYDVTTESEILIDHDNLFVTEDGCYVEAKDLKEGDHFIGPSGDTSVLLKTWREVHPEGIEVYNFKVADNSNYFVIANYADFQNGAEPVLVHNGNKCGDFITDVTPGGRSVSKHAQLNSLDRHKISSYKEVDNVIDNYTQLLMQNDGALDYIKKTGRSRYSLVVFNKDNNEIVSAMQNLSTEDLNRLKKKYGMYSFID